MKNTVKDVLASAFVMVALAGIGLVLVVTRPSSKRIPAWLQ